MPFGNKETGCFISRRIIYRNYVTKFLIFANSPTFAFPKKLPVKTVSFSSLQTSMSVLQARVAQLVEQLICNQLVGGSSPFSGSYGQVEKTGFAGTRLFCLPAGFRVYKT